MATRDGVDLRHVFGPVQSRRLGRSLGVDPVPLKTCNFNCVYCQLGRTERPVSNRRAFFSACELVAEVATAVARQEADTVDWITLVGSGETTLCSNLGYLIRMFQAATRLPVAVITNGSLLNVPRVRRELLAADAVLPSLDAGSDEVFRRINRPHPDFSFKDQVLGLERFRAEYDKRLWVEVMLVADLNDDEAALRNIAEILHRIGPDEVHLSLPDRPPSESWVRAPEAAHIQRAAAIFGGVAKVLEPVEVGLAPEDREHLLDLLLTVVTRHPMREQELIRLVQRRWPGRATSTLDALANDHRFQVVERLGERFWCSAGSRFAADHVPPGVRVSALERSEH